MTPIDLHPLFYPVKKPNAFFISGLGYQDQEFWFRTKILDYEPWWNLQRLITNSLEDK